MNHFKRKLLGFHPCFDGGGGGSGGGGTSTQTSYTAALQPELMPFGLDIAKKAQDLAAADYVPYEGQRIADFNQNQQRQQAEVMGMQTPDQFYQGSQATRMAGLGSLMAGQNYADQATDPGAVGKYMSPYMQNVVDVQKQQALLDYQRGTAMNEKANASRAGAFGGNRQAIMQGMNQEALGRQFGNIQATGTQNAYKDAIQSMQYGSDLGLRGYGQAGQLAGQLAQIGGAQQQADLARLQAQGSVGAQQQALEQKQYDTAYQDFLKQTEDPYSKLAFENSIIRGISPVMPTTTQTYTSNPSTTSQVLSAVSGAAGAAKLVKKGGAIKAYAGGGGVSGGGGVADLERQLQEAKYAPQQVLQASLNKRGPFDPLVAQMAMQWQGEFKTAAQGSQAQQTAQQPSVLDRMRQQQQVDPEMQGLGSTGADVGGFADGGIIGFTEGGATGSWGDTKQPPSIYDILRRREQRGFVPTTYDPLPEGMSLDLEAMRKWREGQRNKYAVQGPPEPPASTALVNPLLPGEIGEGPTKPQGTQAAAKKASATAGANKSTSEVKLPDSILKPKDEAGIAVLKAPSAEEDIAKIDKYVTAADRLTKTEREALNAAIKSGDAQEAAEGGKRRDTAQGLALLKIASALARPGQSTSAAMGQAFEGIGDVGAKYHANEQAIADARRKQDIAHKQGLLALKQGDVKLAADLAEKSQQAGLKARELENTDRYHRDIAGVERRKVGLAETKLPAEMEYLRKHGNYFDKMAAAAAGKGGPKAITYDQAFDNITKLAKQNMENLQLPPAERKKWAGIANDPAQVHSLAVQMMKQTYGDTMMNPNVLMEPPKGASMAPPITVGG